MPQLATEIINFLVGIGLFIAGMNIMSAGLKKTAGKSLKRLFNRIKNNRFAALGIGAGVTALIQSSGATSVMAVGFINAGVMTVFQGICIILGAYIGTTITGILVSLSSIQGLSSIMALTVFVGIILNFIKKEKVRNIGEILIGLGILFVGLEFMKGAFTAGPLRDAFQSLFASINSPILLLLVGALFTCLTQSSSATSGIVIVMAAQGAFQDPSAPLYLVLGATIGTVIVTIIASIGGNANGKRTALMCLIIRVLTALMALAILWPVEICCNHVISGWLFNTFGIEFGIALFLVFYNLIFVGLVLPFVEQFVKLGEKLIKDKDEINRRKVLKYIDDRLLLTPSVALGQAKNEIDNMAVMARDNLKLSFEMLTTLDLSHTQEVMEREDGIDYINYALTEYLIKLSSNATVNDEYKVGRYFHIINDVERIGDHACNLLSIAQKIKEEDLHFSELAINELQKMFDIIYSMFEITQDVFMNHRSDRLPELHALEETTDNLKKKLTDMHFERVRNNLCTNELSPFFTTIVSDLERVADHLVNIGYSYFNPTGDETLSTNQI